MDSVLEEKDKSLGKFKEWHEMVQNEFGKKVKMLRLGKGIDFACNDFEDYYISHRIKWQNPSPHTTQQNGVMKHKSLMIYKMARSMMKGKNLQKTFQAEASTLLSIFSIAATPKM